MYACWGCFFFQAEDGIRDGTVTGVQTCALPILVVRAVRGPGRGAPVARGVRHHEPDPHRRRARRAGLEIGRASCRERGELLGAGGGGENKITASPCLHRRTVARITTSLLIVLAL